MGRPNHVNILGATLFGPESLSDMCEQIALRVSRLDADYGKMFNMLLEELTINSESEKIRMLSMSLQAKQQEVKEIFEKVRGTSNPYVVTTVCPICKYRKTFDSRIGYCADCAQGDPVADLEE